jgi:hypothetical protein
MVFGKEPALIISAIVAVLTLAVAFGVDVTETQTEAIVKVATSLLALAGGAVIRSQVTSDDTLRKAGTSTKEVVRKAEINEARKKE